MSASDSTAVRIVRTEAIYNKLEPRSTRSQEGKGCRSDPAKLNA